MVADSPAHADTSTVAKLLRDARTIAVVGASLDPWRPSSGVVAYLLRAGYRVIPVNPTLLGSSVEGEPFRASLRDLREPPDIVDVFRRSEHIPGIVEDCIVMGVPALWLQLGIHNAEAVSRAEGAGISVVTDRCISVEHRRLGRQWP